jgi:hypothetical protein
MRGTAEGPRAWDLLPESTMINTLVQEFASSSDGHAVKLRYKDGQQRITIPLATTIVTYLPDAIIRLPCMLPEPSIVYGHAI